MAFQMGYRKDGDFFGLMINTLGQFLCGIIGNISFFIRGKYARS
jgi:hypothetical protein